MSARCCRRRFRFVSVSSSTWARCGAVGLAALSLFSASAEETETAASVKAYLVNVVKEMKKASADFVKASEEYSRLVKTHGGVSKAYEADSDKLEALLTRMQGDYRAMDSFGYETVEGIVAGVDSLAHYDIYLDAGVPAKEGPEDVAPVTLVLPNGEKIEQEGALFTYIIEPALWGGDERWVVAVGEKKLPRAEVLTAAAVDVDAKIAALLKDSEAWKASVEDCFGAMVVMTPTLSDYFEDWKESRYAETKSGRFQAVSRISDMKGIMSSCAVMFKAVKPRVAAKDKALAKAVEVGFDGILSFIDLLEERERTGRIKEAEIDELASQAKEKTDKLVPQIEQAAAVAGVKAG